MEALREKNSPAMDRGKFKEIYEQYHQILLQRFTLLIGSGEKAKDILQEVFMKVWIQRAKIDTELSLKAYMYRIGYNLIMDHYRHDKVKRVYLLRTKSRNRRSFINEEEIFQEKRDSELEQIINLLPPKRRQIFKLCKIEELSYKEVSTLLDVSQSTISDHIVKAKRFIKSEWHQRNKYSYGNA